LRPALSEEGIDGYHGRIVYPRVVCWQALDALHYLPLEITDDDACRRDLVWRVVGGNVVEAMKGIPQVPDQLIDFVYSRRDGDAAWVRKLGKIGIEAACILHGNSRYRQGTPVARGRDWDSGDRQERQYERGGDRTHDLKLKRLLL
jgi:hypothetical protein